jgi:superfamily I DNA/RNA helicase
MARLQLFQSTDARRLLEVAAADFLRLPDPVPDANQHGADLFASPPTLLVLRQGGLRDDLLGLAAKRSVPGWFDPPVCLFQDFHEWLGSTERKPCGDYERLVLLTRVMRDHASHVFARIDRPEAFVDSVDRLFGELASEGVSADAFDAACDNRPHRDTFEQARDADLVRCYRAYGRELDAHGRRDGRDTLVDCAMAIRADAAAFARRLRQRRAVNIVGLQDLRGGWNVLLEALRESPALDVVALYSMVAIEPALRVTPDSAQWIGTQSGLSARLFGDRQAQPETDDNATIEATAETRDTPLAFVSAPDTHRETDEVARRVRVLLDEGVAPQQIAIVARSARPAIDRMLDALERRGVPATARRRHAFAEIPVIRSVLSLFQVAAEGWTRHGLVELAEQPYFARMVAAEDAPARSLDATILNHIGYRRRTTGLEEWIEAHRELYASALAFEQRIDSTEESERRAKDVPPRSQRVHEAMVRFQNFVTLAGDLDRPRSLRDWVLWLETFLTEDPWRIKRQVYRVPDSRFDVARLDAAGLWGLGKIITQWSGALETWDGGLDILDVSAFESQLRETLSGDVALWTETRRGVQVMEALAAAQRTFGHVFLIGLSGETFPLRPPRSPVLDEIARRHLSGEGIPLDLRSVWESRERDLLSVLVAGARSSLTCSWAREDGEGRQLAASAFAEEIVIASAGEDAWPSLVKLERDPRGERPEGWTETTSPVAEIPAFARSDVSLSFTVMPASLVIPPGHPVLARAEARAYAIHAASIEALRHTGLLSPWNGEITDPVLLAWLESDRLGEETHIWSATQLEGYAKCPWAWFAERLLRLSDLDDPDLDVDPLVRGSVMHDALSRFYNAAQVRTGAPVLLRTVDLDWALPMLRDALNAAILAHEPLDWLGPLALRPTKRAELERMLAQYIEWEAGLGEQHYSGSAAKKKILRTGVNAHEHGFGASTGAASERDLTLDLGGVRFRIRGSIDRVEIGIDERLPDPERYVAAVDYKSGIYSTPGAGKPRAWDDNVVLQPPLYAHALEQTTGMQVARIEYRAIKQRKTAHSVELYSIPKSGLTRNPKEHERMKRALEAAGRHVAAARAGEFPAQPARSCGCPPFCQSWDICRVRNGPRKAE